MNTRFMYVVGISSLILTTALNASHHCFNNENEQQGRGKKNEEPMVRIGCFLVSQLYVDNLTKESMQKLSNSPRNTKKTT